MATKNFIMENTNPNNERVGDCVIRAITKLEEKPYEEILEDITKDNADKYCYQLPEVYRRYLEENGYQTIMGNGLSWQKPKNGSRYGITTINMAALLSKAIGKPIAVASNTHMAAVLPDGLIYDTWSSGRRKAKEFYIKDGKEFLKEFNITTKDLMKVWFERLPNGTAILYNDLEELARWKNGERIS